MHLKTLIRYPLDIHRARKMLAGRLVRPGARQVEPTDAAGMSSPSRPGRPIVLDLRTSDLLIDCGRHLMTLACWAASIGSPFSLRCPRLVLSAIARKIHGRELLGETNVHWIDASASGSQSSLPHGALVLTDSAIPIQSCRGTDETRVRLLIGRDIDSSLPVMPYPMHPATLRSLGSVDLESLRRASRRCSVFFAGNQKSKYGDEKMHHQFGVVPRLKLLQALRGTHLDRVSTAPCEQTIDRSVPSLPETSRRRIVLVDSRQHSIPAEHWLETIAAADFFLCCPGAAQPTCHNLVEAMSVGTIPLLEYGDRMTPALRDGENAICFRGASGLIEAIDRIDALSSEDLERLRCGAIRYYEQHLNGPRFLQGLCEETLNLSQGQICVPFHDRNLYPTATKTNTEKAA